MTLLEITAGTVLIQDHGMPLEQAELLYAEYMLKWETGQVDSCESQADINGEPVIEKSPHISLKKRPEQTLQWKP